MNAFLLALCLLPTGLALMGHQHAAGTLAVGECLGLLFALAVL
jgi:hypothetical protein